MQYLDNALDANNIFTFISKASKNKDKIKQNLYYFYPSLVKLLGQEEDTKISQLIDSSDLSQVKQNRLKLLEDLYFKGDNRNQDKIIQDISDTFTLKEGESSSALNELKEKLKTDPENIETLSRKREGKRFLSKIEKLANTYKTLLDNRQDVAAAKSLSLQQVEDAVMPVEEKVKRIKATPEEKKLLNEKLEEVKKKLPNVNINVKKLQDNIRKMIRSRSAKSISKQMDDISKEISTRQDETMPTTTEQPPTQPEEPVEQKMTTTSQPKLRGKKSKKEDEEPTEPLEPDEPEIDEEEKEEEKPTTKKPPAEIDEPVPISLQKTEVSMTPPPPPPQTQPPPSISLNRPKKERKDKITDVMEDSVPTKVDLIPEKRLSSEDKSLEELMADIDYFYKNFPDKLRRIKKTKSKNIEVVRRFHRRIVALLRGEKKEDKKNIGVVIKGSDFIKEKLKEIILENSINGLSAEDLLVNIEGEPQKDKTDAGAYEFKTNKTSGKTYAKNEPVFRYIPQTEPPKPQRKINRIPNPKTMFRSQYTTARREVAKNPFLTARQQPSIKLKTLY